MSRRNPNDWLRAILARARSKEHAQQDSVGDNPQGDVSNETGKGIGKDAHENAASVLQGTSPDAAKDDAERPSKGQTAMDSVQLGMDAAGVADPTPIVDGINAAISLVRAVKDPKRRSEHLQNAAISAVSMIPYIGDTAKLLKAKRAGKTIEHAVEHTAEATKAKQANRDAAREMVDRWIEAFKQKQGIEADARKQSSDEGSNVAPPDAQNEASNVREQQETENGLEQQERSNQRLKDWSDTLLHATGVVGKLALASVASVKGIQLLNTGVMALNRDLAEVNGQLAQSYAEFDADEIKRRIEKGQAISGPMSELVERQSELQSRIDTFSNPLQALGVWIQAKLTQGVNIGLAIVEAVPFVKSALKKLEESLGNESDQLTDWQTFFADVSDGKFDGHAPKFDGKRTQILPNRDHREVFGP